MNNSPIRVRISLTFISLIVTFATIVIWINYNNSLKNSYDLSNKIITQAAHSIIEKTKYYLSKSNTSLKILGNNNKTYNIYDIEGLNKEVMWELLLSEKHIASVFLADKYSNFFQVRRDPKLAIRKIEQIDKKRVDFYEYKDRDDVTLGYTSKIATYDPTIRPWYKDTNDKRIHISKPYIFASTKKLGITISYGSFDKYGNKLAVSAVDITLDTLRAFMKEQADEIKGEIHLFDQNYNLISSSKDKIHEHFLKDKEINKDEHIYFKLKQNFLDKNFEGVEEIYGERFIYKIVDLKLDNDNKLGVLVTIPEDIVLGKTKEMLYITVGISFLFLLIFVVLSFGMSKMISRPITKFAKDINNLRELKVDTLIESDSKITEIYQAQNALISLQSGIKAFKKYMPSDLVKQLIETKQDAKIGGVEKNLAVMFTDIESFTTISETLTPAELTNHLSIYFDEMEKVISKHNGTIDKYIGDAIMAFWGAPIDIDEPVKKAVDCALAMQKRLKELNEEWQSEGKAVLNTRIGIHYGKTLVGNIGSPNRMNYTIVGDTVNVASRLEGINKNYKTNIMISEEVYNLIKDQYKIIYIDNIELKGKTSATKIFSFST